MRRALAMLWLTAATVGLVEWTAFAQSAPNTDIQVTTSIDRTAVWPGDRVTYVVEFHCAPNVDVLPDDLAQDKLKLEGLDAVNTESVRESSGNDRTTIRVRYRLASYDVTSPTLRIGNWAARYFVRRPGQRPEDAVPAGEVRIPGAVLAARSTLPEELQTLDLRTGRPFDPLPSRLRFARPVGIGLLILSAAPIGLWLAAFARKMRRPHQRRSTRASRDEIRGALEQLRSIDASAASERREAFARLDKILRGHLAQVGAIPALALTADEVSERFGGSDRIAADQLTSVLADCESARYAPPDRVPSADRLRTAVETTEALVLESRR
jgi:hypothetical protein